MSKESVTVAGIDCGTNSIRLKIARVDADGMHEVVPRILRVIRLGQDVDKTHRFADEALERAYVAAREFAGVIAEHPIDGLRFVATSATRDAENREEFEDKYRTYPRRAPRSHSRHRRSRPGASLVPLPWSIATICPPPIWWLISAAGPPSWSSVATASVRPLPRFRARFP